MSEGVCTFAIVRLNAGGHFAEVKDLGSPVIAAGHQQIAVDRVHMA